FYLSGRSVSGGFSVSRTSALCPSSGWSAVPRPMTRSPARRGFARRAPTTRLYPGTARELRLAFAKVVASEPRVSLAEAAAATLTDRYVQRSEHLGFPDTI